MQALLSGELPVSAWRWGQYLLRPSQRQLLRDGESVEVEDRVFDLLLLLLQHRERALDRQEVIVAIWGKRPVSDATLRQLVYKTRRAVGDDGEHQATIATLYGRSLQWVAPVTPVFGESEVAPAEGAPSSGPAVAASAEGAPPPAAPLGSSMEPAAVARERRAGKAVVFGFDRRRGPDRRRASVPDAPPRSAPTVIPGRRDMPGGRRLVWLLAALVVLAGAGLAASLIHRQRSGTTASDRSPETTTLAVLPLKDLDPRPDRRYVSDGLTEELINRLGRVPHVRVTARTSSFVFRDKSVDVREVAQKLGVANVLEGSVQPAGGRLRVRVALVDARNGYELWSGEYDADAGDLLGMEDRIAGSVVATLYPRLARAAVERPGETQHVAAAAHDDYLVGLQYLRRGDTTDIHQAIAFFQRAIQATPDYEDAWTALATGYAIVRDYDPDERPDTHYADARAAVDRALLLDAGSSRAHALLGSLYMRHWQWPQAAAEYQRALQLDPSDAAAHQWYAIYFWYVGDMRNGLAQMRLARSLDPLAPGINADLSRALLFAGDVDGAIRQGEVAVALAPNFELAHLFLGEAWERKGRLADAIRETRAGMALIGSPPESDDLSSLGRMQWAAGDHADALRLRDELEARARKHYVSGVALAYIEWAVGDRDRAFANLDRAAADHDSLLMSVSGVRYREWCSDPRFGRLLASMNLPLR